MDNQYITERLINRQISLIGSISSQYNDNVNLYNRNMSTILTRLNHLQNVLTRSQVNNTNTRTVPPEPNITTSDYARLFTYLLQPIQNETPPLTTLEISNSTQTFIFTQDNSVESDENQCPISLDFFTTGDVVCLITGCGHKFKRNALMEWFRHNSNCPVCRYNLRTHITDVSNNQVNVSSNPISPSFDSILQTSINYAFSPQNSSSEEEKEEEIVFDSSVD